jgi:tetratricopeptide (TPR) repeat protein
MIRQALKADPQSPAYLDSLGWVLYKRGQLEDSAKALQQATQLAPELDSVLWDHLGDAFWRLSRARDASAAWQRAADILRKQGEDARKEELQRLQMKVKSVESGKAPDVAPLGATPQGDAEPPAGQPK